MDEISRRAFAAGAASLAAGTWAATASGADGGPPDFAVEDQRPFGGQTRRLKVLNRGRYVTSLIFATDYPTHFRLKPELYPVLTPAGLPVTDTHSYCFIHHQSIMAGHGKVSVPGRERPVDFYRKLNFPQENREDTFRTAFNLFDMGPSGIQLITSAEWEGGTSARIDLELEWRTRLWNDPGGETLLRERRRYLITQRGPLTLVDHFTLLAPVGPSAVLQADRHSFCGVRVNDLIDPEDGGLMRDSEGRVNPSGDYWDAEGERRAPRWIDCTGRIGGALGGIAMMGHPGNPRNQHYSREWGLMIVSPTLGDDLRITPEEPLRFAARCAAHDGELAPETADRLAEEFAGAELL